MRISEIISHFNVAIKEGENFSSPARALNLQKEQCAKLESLRSQASGFKLQAINKKNEGDANFFLGYECAIGAVLSQLRMWVLLKLDKGNLAWDQMIAAQMGAADAVRAHEGFAHAIHIIDRLEKIESLIFPPASYVSAGFTAGRLECSICGSKYSSCDHLRHRPYMGKLCEVVHRDIRGDHVAFVKIPADKRCRVTSIKVKDGYQDKISLSISPYKDDEKFSEEAGLEARAILMTSNRYPYLASNVEVFGDRYLSEVEIGASEEW